MQAKLACDMLIRRQKTGAIAPVFSINNQLLTKKNTQHPTQRLGSPP